MRPGEVCPECESVAEASCRCPRGDSMCANKHEWHVCLVHFVVVRGPSDHSTPTFSCTCGAGGRGEGKRAA